MLAWPLAAVVEQVNPVGQWPLYFWGQYGRIHDHRLESPAENVVHELAHCTLTLGIVSTQWRPHIILHHARLVLWDFSREWPKHCVLKRQRRAVEGSSGLGCILDVKAAYDRLGTSVFTCFASRPALQTGQLWLLEGVSIHLQLKELDTIQVAISLINSALSAAHALWFYSVTTVQHKGKQIANLHARNALDAIFPLTEQSSYVHTFWLCDSVADAEDYCTLESHAQQNLGFCPTCIDKASNKDVHKLSLLDPASCTRCFSHGIQRIGPSTVYNLTSDAILFWLSILSSHNSSDLANCAAAAPSCPTQGPVLYQNDFLWKL